MKTVTPFVISEFTNPSGKIVFQLYARINGQRFRRNFPTRTEAEAERQVQELNWLQRDTGTRAAITRLTEDQLHEAEAVYRRLASLPRPLSFYLDFALANYREPEKQKPLAEAVAEYIQAKEHEFAQDQLSPPQMNRIREDLKRLLTAFVSKNVAELSATSITGFLEKDRPGMKTHNNRRGILSTFFKYSFQRGWIAENPIVKVPHYRIRRKRGVAQTLTAVQSAALMEHMETYDGGRWVPYFALCLFAGIRPGVPYGEITKLKSDAVKLEDGVIHIAAEVSKVREPRRIAIQPNLVAWLKAYPLDKGPIILGDFKKRRERFAKKFRSIGEAAIHAGNSEAIIRKHYLDLKTTNEADAFFSIVRSARRLPLGRRPRRWAPQPDYASFTSRTACRDFWDGGQASRFATDKLGLKTAVASLKALGLVHLETLAELIQHGLRTMRASRETAGAESWDATSEAEPEPQRARQVAASEGGRRAKARRGPMSPRACRTFRGSTRARRNRQSGVSSWRWGMGVTAGAATAPVSSGAQVCDG